MPARQVIFFISFPARFTSPLIVLLIAASSASFYLKKQPRDGLILLIIVVMNALIGFYQEMEIGKYTGIHKKTGSR
jgi:magnesium-transporting ATPase (P-type)